MAGELREGPWQQIAALRRDLDAVIAQTIAQRELIQMLAFVAFRRSDNAAIWMALVENVAAGLEREHPGDPLFQHGATALRKAAASLRAAIK